MTVTFHDGRTVRYEYDPKKVWQHLTPEQKASIHSLKDFYRLVAKRDETIAVARSSKKPTPYPWPEIKKISITFNNKTEAGSVKELGRVEITSSECEYDPATTWQGLTPEQQASIHTPKKFVKFVADRDE